MSHPPFMCAKTGHIAHLCIDGEVSPSTMEEMVERRVVHSLSLHAVCCGSRAACVSLYKCCATVGPTHHMLMAAMP